MDQVHKPSDSECYASLAEPSNSVFEVLYRFDILGHEAHLRRWTIDLICYMTA
jgi:hypothetical protein